MLRKFFFSFFGTFQIHSFLLFSTYKFRSTNSNNHLLFGCVHRTPIRRSICPAVRLYITLSKIIIFWFQRGIISLSSIISNRIGIITSLYHHHHHRHRHHLRHNYHLTLHHKVEIRLQLCRQIATCLLYIIIIIIISSSSSSSSSIVSGIFHQSDALLYRYSTCFCLPFILSYDFKFTPLFFSFFVV